jgi:phage-related protein
MPVFTWFPDASVSVETEPVVRTARFGDGYEQRVPEGINTMPEKWDLTFTGTRAEIDPIAVFLREHKGSVAFDWTTPDEVTGRFICRKWSKSRERGVKVTMSFTLEQVYGS